jgi:hypothetical protein
LGGFQWGLYRRVAAVIALAQNGHGGRLSVNRGHPSETKMPLPIKLSLER